MSFIGLGGNFPQSLQAIEKALIILNQTEGVYHLRSSRLYRTSPVNVDSLSFFLNAAAQFETILPLLKLFEILESIEKTLGKLKKEKNQSRLIDIDLLFYGNEVFKNEYLEIPHPRLQERLFVLAPLSDLRDTHEEMKNYKNRHHEEIMVLPHILPYCIVV